MKKIFMVLLVLMSLTSGCTTTIRTKLKIVTVQELDVEQQYTAALNTLEEANKALPLLKTLLAICPKAFKESLGGKKIELFDFRKTPYLDFTFSKTWDGFIKNHPQLNKLTDIAVIAISMSETQFLYQCKGALYSFERLQKPEADYQKYLQSIRKGYKGTPVILRPFNFAKAWRKAHKFNKKFFKGIKKHSYKYAGLTPIVPPAKKSYWYMAAKNTTRAEYIKVMQLYASFAKPTAQGCEHNNHNKLLKDFRSILGGYLKEVGKKLLYHATIMKRPFTGSTSQSFDDYKYNHYRYQMRILLNQFKRARTKANCSNIYSEQIELLQTLIGGKK